jgi:hypothetical protein
MFFISCALEKQNNKNVRLALPHLLGAIFFASHFYFSIMGNSVYLIKSTKTKKERKSLRSKKEKKRKGNGKKEREATGKKKKESFEIC